MEKIGMVALVLAVVALSISLFSAYSKTATTERPNVKVYGFKISQYNSTTWEVSLCGDPDIQTMPLNFYHVTVDYQNGTTIEVGNMLYPHCYALVNKNLTTSYQPNGFPPVIYGYLFP
jgi:hypothetical protein